MNKSLYLEQPSQKNNCLLPLLYALYVIQS